MITISISQIMEVSNVKKAVIYDRRGHELMTIRKGDRIPWEIDSQKIHRVNHGILKSKIYLEK